MVYTHIIIYIYPMSSHRPCTQRPSWRSRGSTVPAPAAPGPAPAGRRPAERAAGAAGHRRCPAAAASDGKMGVFHRIG